MMTKTRPATATKPTKKRRTIDNRQADRSGQWLEITGVLDSPIFWEFAALVPPQSVEGKCRKLPTIFYVIMPALAAVWHSYSAAETQLAEAPTWNHLCFLVCKYQRIHRPQDNPSTSGHFARRPG